MIFISVREVFCGRNIRFIAYLPIERKISMRNNRCFKWTTLLMTVILALGLFLSSALANEFGFGFGQVADKATLTGVLIESATVKDETTGTKVTDLSVVDPNHSFTLTLSVHEAKDSTGTMITLPENTDTTPMSYSLVNMRAENGGNEDVSWKYESGMLKFEWAKGKKDGFTAIISVSPAYPETQGLDGKAMAIVTNKNALMAAQRNNGGLQAESITVVDNDTIWYQKFEDAYWTFKHVTADWYTISNNGKYLNINGDLALTDNAQKIKVENKGKYYILSANKKTVSCDGTQNGFRLADMGTAARQQIKLYGNISTDSMAGVADGNYIIANSKTTYKNLLLDQQGTSYTRNLTAAQFQLEGNDTVIPFGNYVMWHFEHVKRDWYYVSNGKGSYLQMLSDGPALSSEPALILVKKNPKSNQYSLSGFGAETVYLNNMRDNAEIGFYLTTNDNYKWLSLYSKVKVEETTIPSGEWLITYSDKKIMMSGENKDSSSIAYKPYQVIDGISGMVTVVGKNEPTYWTFENAGGNYYYVKTNGQYLTIRKGCAALSDQPQKLYIQQKGESYRISDGEKYQLTGRTGSSFSSWYDHDNGSGSWMTLNKVYESLLKFNINGGNVSTAPSSGIVNAGDKVKLPDYTGTKNNHRFIGWAKVSNIYTKREGKDDTYHEVFLPGSEYTVPEEGITLYAVYNEKSLNAQFSFRKSGTTPDEPGNYKESEYIGHFTIDNALKDGKWVVDVEKKDKTVGNHMVNDVTDNLAIIPDDETIKKALKEEGNFDYDPQTQYVQWYVIKYMASGSWHVDGVVRTRNQVGVAYMKNVPEDEKDLVKNSPDGYEATIGTDITIGADANSNSGMTPTRPGYKFAGWNTKEDGSGTTYASGAYVRLNENLNLYAQWASTGNGEMSIMINTNGFTGKPAPAGTMIKLTAELTGFEGKTYTLQWQHSVDKQNWIDEPGANEIDFTYELTAETAQYHWRVIARNVK